MGFFQIPGESSDDAALAIEDDVQGEVDPGLFCDGE